MISVVICRPGSESVWEIDTWLMSCRVLGRKVEHMVLRELLSHARSAGIATIAGTYKPTDRNGLVADHYERLGFAPAGQGPDSATHWKMPVASKFPDAIPMKVISQGFSIESSATA